MSKKLTPLFMRQLLTGLQSAKAYYDAEADELDLLLPDSAGRGGSAVLIGDYYVRIDVETGKPLSVIIYDPHAWLEQELQQVSAPLDQAAQLRAGLEQFLAKAARPNGYQLNRRLWPSCRGSVDSDQWSVASARARGYEPLAAGQAILAAISQVPAVAVA